MGKEDGFFSSSELITKAPVDIFSEPKCGSCRLFKGCASPKMKIYGSGKKKILIIGSFPSREADMQGIPFAGDSAKLLRNNLKSFGVDLERDCWSTNALICAPEDGKVGNQKRIEYCRPNILKAIDRLQPNLILLLGVDALKSLVGHLWKSSPGSIESWVGFQIPDRKFNSWICPNFHPSQVLLHRERAPIIEFYFRRNLKLALEKYRSKPYKEIPSYEDNIDVIFGIDEAIEKIEEFNSRPDRYAIDIEARSLKPEVPGSMILCASISNSEKAIAFPWNRRIEKPLKRFIRNKGHKLIAANKKFEQRFFKYFLGIGAKKWYWDTMLAAHFLDGRKGTKSLKFQSFVHMGIAPYNEHIEPLFEETENSKLNRANEIDRRQLMFYCGVDSYLEIKLSEIQISKIKQKKNVRRPD